MSISFNPDQNFDAVRNSGRPASPSKKAAESGVPAEEIQVQTNPGSYDTISIESHAVAESDSDFVSRTVRETAEAVRQGVSPERVAELKEQVQSGQYKPDSLLIARHLLAHQ